MKPPIEETAPPSRSWLLLGAVLAHAPENAAYGLIAFAPLGAAFGPTAMSLALLCAVVSGAVATLIGGGRLVGGPRASLALLTAGLVGALVPVWSTGAAGDAWRIVAIVGAGVIAAGALQALFGMLRLGGIVKYTPYPVRIGLASGIGLLLAVTAWPVLAGIGFGAKAAWQPSTWHAGAMVVGAAACSVTWLAMWRQSRVPPLLLGLAAGIGVHLLLQAFPAVPGLSRPVGTPLFPPGVLDGLSLAASLPAPPPTAWRATLDLLAPYVLTVAVLCSLDTLLATSLVDGRLRRWRDPNRELVAQGVANIAAGLAGAQPASPSVPRSLSLCGTEPPRRQAVLAYALLMLVFAAAAPWGFGAVPASALGGVLFAQGLAMVSGSLVRTPADWVRWRSPASPARTPGSMLWANWAVSVAVALNAVLLGVGPAVLIGATLAVLLFVRANMRDVVRGEWRGDLRRSLKVRPPAIAASLTQHGRRIAVLELEGSLFFGTGDALRTRLAALAREVDIVVLDLRQIREIDATGARIVFELAEDWASAGKRMLLAEWPAGDARRHALEAIAGHASAAVLQFEDHADRALERAEDELLERLGIVSTARNVVALRDTVVAQGLDETELAALAEATTTVQFERGSFIFRRGDAGDALYISLAGDIGLRVPGSTRRLASFGAGVTLGEIGVLSHGTRSVDAIAESDVTALRLPAPTFDRWKSERPQLAARLLNNISLHLASRLALLTADLAVWVERAGSARAAVTPTETEAAPDAPGLRAEMNPPRWAGEA